MNEAVRADLIEKIEIYKRTKAVSPDILSFMCTDEQLDVIQECLSKVVPEGRMVLDEEEEQNLCEFIEMHILDAIRDDTDINNMGWLVMMVDVFRRMAEDCGYEGLTYIAKKRNAGKEEQVNYTQWSPCIDEYCSTGEGE